MTKSFSKWHLVTWLFTSLFWTNLTLAQNHSSLALNKKLSVIESTCLESPSRCLENIDPLLQSIPDNSRISFKVLQYKFEALFNLQRMEQLYRETKQWLDKPNLPIHFQITNAIYFAKSALAMGDKAASQKQAAIAKRLLGQLNDEYPSPMRLVQFANLQMALHEYQQAHQLLTQLAEKYKSSPDYHFMLELYGNLGHTANFVGKPEEAISHWLAANHWAKLFGNKQQIAVVHFNTANTYNVLEQPKESAAHFLSAIDFAQQAKDRRLTNKARYFFAQFKIKQQAPCEAWSIMESIDESALVDKSAAHLQELKRDSTCKQVN